MLGSQGRSQANVAAPATSTMANVRTGHRQVRAVILFKGSTETRPGLTAARSPTETSCSFGGAATVSID